METWYLIKKWYNGKFKKKQNDTTKANVIKNDITKPARGRTLGEKILLTTSIL